MADDKEPGTGEYGQNEQQSGQTQLPSNGPTGAQMEGVKKTALDLKLEKQAADQEAERRLQAEESANNKKAGKAADDNLPRAEIVLTLKDGTEVTHMDLLKASQEIDARRARLVNGTATKEDIAIQEAAKPAPQPVPFGFTSDRDLLSTHDNNIAHKNEKPKQPIGSTKDLNGKELVQKNLPRDAAADAKPKAAAAWSSAKQEQPEPSMRKVW